MKKVFIAIGVIILVATAVLLAVMLSDGNLSTDETESLLTTDISAETLSAGFVEGEDTVIYVDNWLKITKIFEFDGRLAVMAENVSDTDVEYAVLTVKNSKGTYTFNISALLRGLKVVLLCNDAIGFDADEIYTGWQTDDILNFAKTPEMYEDKIAVSVSEGSIAVKNISGEDISSDILVYYKEKKDDFINGSMTNRIRISGLKASAQTFVNAESLSSDNCEIIFIQY